MNIQIFLNKCLLNLNYFSAHNKSTANEYIQEWRCFEEVERAILCGRILWIAN